MSTDQLGAKLTVAIGAVLMLAAACGKSDNSGSDAGTDRDQRPRIR